MKYLSETMTTEEARQAYRALAKEMHPDVGGDAEDFKVLADEYATIQRLAAQIPTINISDVMTAAGMMVEVIAQTLAELYPRTRVTLNYTPASIDVEFAEKVPLGRMLLIEGIINSFQYPFVATILFKRDPRKSWIKMRTVACHTWINAEVDSATDLKDTPVFKGRRYSLHQGSRYEMCVDKREGHAYFMRRIPQCPLRELVGF